MNMNYIDGCEQDILQKYQISQLEVMVKQYELDPFFRINAKMTINSLSIDQSLDYLCEASVLKNEWSRQEDEVNISSVGSIAAFHKVWKNCVQSDYLRNVALDIDSIMGVNFPTLWAILKRN